MFPAAGLGKSNHFPASPQWSLFAKANRIFTSVVKMVLTDWNPARAHADITDYLTISARPSSLHYVCVVERDLSELFCFFLNVFIYFNMPCSNEG